MTFFGGFWTIFGAFLVGLDRQRCMEMPKIIELYAFFAHLVGSLELIALADRTAGRGTEGVARSVRTGIQRNVVFACKSNISLNKKQCPSEANMLPAGQTSCQQAGFWLF